jgi:hypothetical protein
LTLAGKLRYNIPMQTTATANEAKVKNPYRISLNQYCEDNGIEDRLNLIEDLVSDSICPALCKEGCEVEPDGRCEHNCPSILLACGLI